MMFQFSAEDFPLWHTGGPIMTARGMVACMVMNAPTQLLDDLVYRLNRDEAMRRSVNQDLTGNHDYSFFGRQETVDVDVGNGVFARIKIS